MSEAGQRLIEGARQALEYAQCEHEWVTSISGRVEACRKCKCRRYNAGFLATTPPEAELSRVLQDLADRREPLGAEFEAAIYDNLDELYEE